MLSDPEKRKQYDPLGSTNGRAGAGGGTTFDFGDFDLGDIFGGLFGRGRGAAAAAAARPARQRRRGRGARLVRGRAAGRRRRRCPVQLELACHTCHGTGAAPGTAPMTLPAVRRLGRRRDLAGAVRAAAAVPALPRHGLDRRDAVPDVPRLRPRAAHEALHGARSRPASKDGTRIKLKGKGEAGYGGAPAGDLYVVTRVEPSKIYERRGDDLVVAGAGHRIRPPRSAARSRCRRPRAPVSLKVPAGTEDGKLLRIKGRGAPQPQGLRARATCSRASASRCRSASIEEAARAARGAAEGGRLNADDRPRYMIWSPPSSSACIRRRCASTSRRGSCARSAPPATRASTPTRTSSGCG